MKRFVLIEDTDHLPFFIPAGTSVYTPRLCDYGLSSLDSGSVSFLNGGNEYVTVTVCPDGGPAPPSMCPAGSFTVPRRILREARWTLIDSLYPAWHRHKFILAWRLRMILLWLKGKPPKDRGGDLLD